jgi:hypothetical protein
MYCLSELRKSKWLAETLPSPRPPSAKELAARLKFRADIAAIMSAPLPSSSERAPPVPRMVRQPWRA